MITGLFRTIRKRLQLTCDNDMGAFREKLELVVKEKDRLGEDEISEKVTELVGLTEDLPDGEEKEKLLRYLEDFKGVKAQEADVAMEAAKAVSDLFEKLDTDAMEKDVAEEKPAEEIIEKEEEIQETEKAMDAEAAEPDQAKDEDPDPEYSLNEIYQYIKRRMAEDAEAAAEEQVKEKTEEKIEDGKCGVMDGIPGISLENTKTSTGKAGLDDIYKKIKGVR